MYETTDKEPEKADTVEELAMKLGLDPQELRKTVNDYNAAVDRETSFDLMTLDSKFTSGLSPNKTST